MSRETDCVVRRKKFEERIWKRDETFANYYHEKTILANQVPINANEMVILLRYLIRGIPNENLRNQVRLQKFAGYRNAGSHGGCIIAISIQIGSKEGRTIKCKR